MITEEALLSEFNFIGVDKLEPSIVVKCFEIAAKYKLDEERLVEEWIAFAQTNLGGNLNPTLTNLDTMVRKQLEGKQEKTVAKAEPVTPKEKKIQVFNRSMWDEEQFLLDTYSPKIPEEIGDDRKYQKKLGEIFNFSPASYNPKVSQISTKYAERKDRGSQVNVFGSKELLERDSAVSEKVSSPARVKFLGNYDAWNSPSGRYMFDPLDVEASLINSRIDSFRELLMKKYAEAAEETTTKIVGQIRCEGDRLNAASILLQTSVQHRGGESLSVYFQEDQSLAVFPGQIILLEGVLKSNPNATKSLYMHKFFFELIPELPKELPVFANSEPLKIIVASGPYTLSDNLAYQPLQDLIKYVIENQPNVLILIGPFVDMRHGSVADGTMAETYRSHFENLMERIVSPLKDTKIQIIVVPSTLDAHHHSVYPTPPFDPLSKNRFMSNHVHMASDPSLISINDVIVGVTSVDVLFHLAKTEFYHRAPITDRMARLINYIVSQRSFYPIYPPVAISERHKLSVDQQLMKLHGEFHILPHILILPSNLNQFIKNVEGCIIINPERLSKGLVGGCFASINIFPGQETQSIENNFTCRIIKI